MLDIQFKAGSTDSLAENFEARLEYRNNVSFEGMIDTWYDRPYYGLVNKNFEPVILICASELATDPEENLESILTDTFSPVADDIRALNFAVDAFNFFRSDYIDIISRTNVEFPAQLSGLVPTAGYRDFKTLYFDYVEFLVENIILNLDVAVDFSELRYRDFVYKILELILPQSEVYPVTKSGFLLSKHNDFKTTGLVIELAKLSTFVDADKAKILLDPNFQCFVDFASSAGFYVDKNAPWRLCVNLDSEITRLLMRNENLVEKEDGTRAFPENENNVTKSSSAHEVLDSIYRVKTHYEDLLSLIVFMNKMFVKVKERLAIDQSIVYNEIEYDRQQGEGMEASVQPKEWISMLLMLRLHEIESFERGDFTRQFQEILFIHDTYGMRQAEGKIGEICSKKLKEKYEQYKRNNTTTT